ncbi:MAG: chemotaxis protein CheB, partial [Pseudomonadota bacterium]
MQNDGQDAASARTSRSIGEVDQSFYLIGVGASAGGLDAIKQLISQIPTGFPHSFVIIQHLSPDYKSLMSDILGRETIMPVSEVADHMPIESGHIYLIPPKSNVVIQGTEDDISLAAEEGVVAPVNGLRFSLVDPSPRPQLNLPIDLFFHSLAEAVAERSIAIVLSGTGSDGSRGLRGIKDRDGFVLVQDPETAAFDGMPRAAIGTKIVDLVCSPDAMIGELQRYLQMREGGVVSVDTLFEGAESEFADLLKLISETADIDFSQYKEPTLKRRIARRMVLRKCDTVSEYLKIARADPSEVSVIYREFLVGVTNFFRDLPSWRDLEAEYLPRIFANAKKGETVKVWSVGCSTGEEAYTIAFLIEAYRRRNEIETEFRVFASDVNASAIAIAKEGVYPNSTLDEIPNEFREQNFFTFHGESFHISQSIRSRVIFSSHNVLENAPYVRTDLIVCRNLMIYLSPEMQKKVLSVFSFSLRKNGFLFLGAAENIGRNSAGFDAMRGPGRIFQNVRKAPVDLPNTRSGAHLPLLHAGLTPMPRARRIATREIQRQNSETTSFLPKLLMQLNTAVFILNENGHIVETFGDYRRYLSMPEDAFSSNLVELVTGRLRSTISLLFRRASTEGAGEKRSIRLLEDPDSNYVDVYSQKIEWESYPTAYLFMIQVSQPPTVAVGDGNGADRAAVQPALIGQLESEIEALQEMLSVTAEDLGVSNEELQTTNEELTASNEELQANNEEMQSINE